MKALCVFVVVACIAAVNAGASTHSPCARHSAITPYISLATADGARLTGAGDIGGCPYPVGTESVSITVCLQLDDVDVSCETFSRAWSRYNRFARQAGGTVYATCLSGTWRTVVRGGDGFAPTEWYSDPITFTTDDESECRHI